MEETKKQLEMYLVRQIEAAGGFCLNYGRVGIDMFLREYKILQRRRKMQEEEETE